MRRLATVRRALPLLLLAAASACAGAQARPAGGAPMRDEIVSVLQASTVEWNRGSLDGFLVPYAASSTFIGREVVRGKDAIREFYRTSWFRTGAPTVNLGYRDIEVRPLGPSHALVVGRWVVSDKSTGQETRTGWFTLTFARTPEGWRIIHDHSS